MSESGRDRSTWAIGGGVVAGTGVGLIFLEASPVAFAGCIIAGLGLGLVVTAVISSRPAS